MFKRRLLSLTLAICMFISMTPATVFALASTINFSIAFSNGAEGTVSYKLDNQSEYTLVTVDQNGRATINDLNGATSIIVNVVPGGGFTVNDGRSGVFNGDKKVTSFSFENNSFEYTLSDFTPEFRIEFDNTSGSGDNGGGAAPEIELMGATSITDGEFNYDHGVVRVDFLRQEGMGDGAYNGTSSRIKLSNGDTYIKITLKADDGYTGILTANKEGYPMPTPEQPINNNEFIYILPVNDITTNGDNNFISFRVDFVNNGGGNTDNPEQTKPVIELLDSKTIANGVFGYAKDDNFVGNVVLSSVTENDETVYNGDRSNFTLGESDTAVKLTATPFTAGYYCLFIKDDGELVFPENNNGTYTYIIERSVIESADRKHVSIRPMFLNSDSISTASISQDDTKYASVDNGVFSYENGSAGITFIKNNQEVVYNGTDEVIELSEGVTAVKLVLTAEDGYEGDFGMGPGFSWYGPYDYGDKRIYVIERSEITKADDNNAILHIDFKEKEAAPDWYTVSCGGGNVTVENGKVIAERVHIGDSTFTINENEISEADKVYSISVLENEQGLIDYGVAYGETDIFVMNGLDKSVSIDYKFIPDYGYQVKDIVTNEENSLLENFDASPDEISTFNFEVRPGGAHFEVIFKKSDDIFNIDSESVKGVYIENGGNATDSGNLKMTVSDIDKNNVSDELKAMASEDALYLDMNLYQVVSKGGENGNWENQLENLDGTITVTLRVPAPEQGSTYYIVREHGNVDKEYSRIEVEFVPDEDDPTMGTVTFETDRFSNYALSQSKFKTETKIESDTIVSAKVESDSWNKALPEEAKNASEVKLVVKDSVVSSDSKFSAVSGVSPKAGKTLFVDLSLYAIVGGQQTPVKELNDFITITLKVPSISDSEQYTVVREHKDSNGNVTYEKIEDKYVTYDPVTSTLTIKTKKFSIYALFVSDKPSSNTSSSTAVTRKPIPNTSAGLEAVEMVQISNGILYFFEADDADKRRR